MEKPRITIRLETEEEYQQLESWAKEEFLSTPQLVKAIVRKAIAAKFEGQPQEENTDAANLLLLLAENHRPTDEQIIIISQSLGISSKKLLAVRDRLFPKTNGSNKRSAMNA